MAALDHDPALTADGPGLTIIAHKGYVSRELDTYLGLTRNSIRLIITRRAEAPA